MVDGDKAEDAEVAAVAVAEVMPEEEDLAEAEVEAEVEEAVAAEEAAEPQPLIPMTQAGATPHLNGGA